MSLRIRADGRILCAAMHPEEPGDVYLHDGISYSLTCEHGVLVTEEMHQETGRGGHANHGEWWWRDAVPADVVADWSMVPLEFRKDASGRSLPTPACRPRSEVVAPLGSLAPAVDSRAIASSAGGRLL